MTISATSEAPESFKPFTWKALASLLPLTCVSLNLISTSGAPEIWLLLSNDKPLILAFGVKSINAVSNPRDEPAPPPVNKVPDLISRVVPVPNVNVLPEVPKVKLVFSVCADEETNFILASAFASTSFIANTKSPFAVVVKFAFVPKWSCNSVIPPTTVVAL